LCRSFSPNFDAGRGWPGRFANLEGDMKAILLAAVVSLCAAGAAQAASCKAQAGEKKLAGAALTSFMKKCETDATKACETDSAQRKLAGAAKASHMKKCVADAVGS
jgi:hypothetical protein